MAAVGREDLRLAPTRRDAPTSLPRDFRWLQQPYQQSHAAGKAGRTEQLCELTRAGRCRVERPGARTGLQKADSGREALPAPPRRKVRALRRSPRAKPSVCACVTLSTQTFTFNCRLRSRSAPGSPRPSACEPAPAEGPTASGSESVLGLAGPGRPGRRSRRAPEVVRRSPAQSEALSPPLSGGAAVPRRGRGAASRPW